MLRLIIATVVLATVAVVLRRRIARSPKLGQLRITARTAMHRNAVLAVVEVEGRRLLVGAAAHQVTLLTELEPSAPAPARPRAALPSELPVLDEHPAALLDRVRRATTRTLDPAARSRSAAPPAEDGER